MFNKEINPIISAQMYEFMRLNMMFKPSDVKFESLSYYFIKAAREFFKMKRIAMTLGVSQRHCYRILDAQADYSKGFKINQLIVNLILSRDYQHFITLCNRDKIIVRGGLYSE